MYVSEMLQPKIIPFLQGNPRDVFQQDNALPYVAKTVRDLCSSQHMQLVPCPNYSPYKSPIENICDLAGQRLARNPRPAANKTKFDDCHIVRNARVQPTVSSAAIQGHVAPLSGAPVSSQTTRTCLAEGHLGSWCTLRVLPWTPTHQRLCLEWGHVGENWTAHEEKQVIFSDEYRFNLSSDNIRVHVWRPRGECLNPTFALQRLTAPTAGVRVWSAIACNTRSPLVLIYDNPAVCP
ncbi:transposable element Tcb2 transposase [Trichonephila clavipes]|nr:transposable element Tcb2 transposase [Trichonephila clavipes]